jgi:hypothetical protein
MKNIRVVLVSLATALLSFANAPPSDAQTTADRFPVRETGGLWGYIDRVPDNGQVVVRVWRDIEYLPGSSCGKSYHTLYLASGEYWEFVNEIEGSVNGGQFWRRLDYYSVGSMNPYTD